jgi:hypothetical protein
MPRESVKKGIHIHRIYLPKLKFIAFVLFLLKAVLALHRIDPQTLVNKRSQALKAINAIARVADGKVLTARLDHLDLPTAPK